MRRLARSCWPATAPRAPGRARPCAASPRRWASRWRPRSTARACSPTTTRWRWARSGSCGTTTSTSASTTPTSIIAVGYELQEFDPARINPDGDTKIIHLHRFPAEVDAHYDVAVGLHADIGRSLDALAEAVGPRPAGAGRPGSARCSPPNSPAASATTASRSRRPGSWPTPGPRCAARTSCWWTPAR